MIIELPIETSPPLKTYNNIAFLGSVILTNKELLPLYLSNFTLLESNFRLSLTSSTNVSFHNSDVFDASVLNASFFNKKITNDFFMFALKKGYYIYSCVDEFFIPNRLHYKKKSFIHDILIYGYDESENSFLTIAYDESRQYIKQKIRSTEILQASINLEGNLDTIFYKISNKVNPEFDFNIFHSETFSYFHSLSLNGQKEKNKFFGIDAVKSLISYFDDIGDYIDLRIFKMLNEHRRFMSMKFKYLKEHFKSWTFNSEEFIKIEELSQTLINVCVKYRVRPSKKTLSKAKTLIEEIVCRDKLSFNKLLHYLDSVDISQIRQSFIY